MSDYPENWSTTPGIYDGIPNEVYHADRKAVSRSWLKEVMRSPLHLQHYLNEPIDSTKPALVIGSALHTLLFELLTWPDRVAVFPEWLNLRKKDDRAERDRFLIENAGKTIIKADQLALVEEMAEAVQRHPKAMALIDLCDTFEQTLVWQDTAENRALIAEKTGHRLNGDPTGLFCKARSDARGGGWWCDVKSTRNAQYEKFTRDCTEFGYTLQPPFYMDGGICNGLPPDHFIFLCVENVPPHGVAQYRVDELAIQAGRELYIRQLEKIAALDIPSAGAKDIYWDGYPAQIIDLDYPQWWYKQQDIDV